MSGIEDKIKSGDPIVQLGGGIEKGAQVTVSVDELKKMIGETTKAQLEEVEVARREELKKQAMMTEAEKKETSSPITSAIGKAYGERDGAFRIAKTLSPAAIATDAQGNYTVPSFVQPSIYDVIQQYGLRSKCLVMPAPLGFGGGYWPTVSAKPSVSVIGREAQIPDTRHTLSRVTITFYKLAGIYAITNALLKDSSLQNWEAFIRQSMAEAFAKAEDNQIINGTGSSEFTGITYLSGVKTAYLGNASNSGMTSIADIKPSDALHCDSAVDDGTEVGAELYLAKETYNALLGSKNVNGQYHFRTDVQNPSAFGIPIKKHILVPATDSANSIIGVYGNLKNMLLMEKGGLEVSVSKEATVDTINLFEYDMTGFKFSEEIAVVSLNDGGFCLLKTSAS